LQKFAHWLHNPKSRERQQYRDNKNVGKLKFRLQNGINQTNQDIFFVLPQRAQREDFF
jgi:hypothetical protein